MIQESRNQTYYEILDIKTSATPELIREAYVRAKNAFAHDSLAAYSLFDKNQSKKMLEEIEVAYNVLSDPEKRKNYDVTHGYIRSSMERVEQERSIYEDHEEVSEVGMLSKPNQNSLENFFFEQPKRISIDQISISKQFTPPPTPSLPNIHEEYLRSVHSGVHFIHAQYERHPDMESLINNVEAVDGSILRKIREYKNVTIEEMMDFTKLTRRYIEAIESDTIDKLPAPVYVRGFIILYAKALRLDSHRVTASYMRNFQNIRESRGLR